ncbi:MAG: ATPase [Oscillospiraceae bacterium]|jgi:hypothetical protein
MSLAKTEYFLGCVSPDGFTTHFDKKIAGEKNFTYILKGGAGTGKSSLMKKIALKFSDKDEITVHRCSSDPDSLDAVVLNNAGVIVVDGTAPHVFEPVYAGVKQKIINLGDFWDSEKLTQNSEGIIASTKECLRWHKRCKSFVSALSSLNSDTYSIALESLDFPKLDAYIARLSKKLFQKGKTGEGKTVYSQLSAMTPNGYMTLSDTFCGYKKIYSLNDGCFSGSDAFLRELATVAVSKGYTVIVSECTLLSSKVFEHMLIPEISTAFINSSPINGILLPDADIINFKRFYDKGFLAHKKQRLSFNRKASQDLTAEAAAALKNAKSIHDEIEKYYIEAMDFIGINALTDKLIGEIEEKLS